MKKLRNGRVWAIFLTLVLSKRRDSRISPVRFTVRLHVPSGLKDVMEHTLCALKR